MKLSDLGVAGRGRLESPALLSFPPGKKLDMKLAMVVDLVGASSASERRSRGWRLRGGEW